MASVHAPGSPNLCSKHIAAGTCSWAASTLVSNPPKGLNKPLRHAFHFGTTLQTTSLMKCWIWGAPVPTPPSPSASGRMLVPCCALSWAPGDSGDPPRCPYMENLSGRVCWQLRWGCRSLPRCPVQMPCRAPWLPGNISIVEKSIHFVSPFLCFAWEMRLLVYDVEQVF